LHTESSFAKLMVTDGDVDEKVVAATALPKLDIVASRRKKLGKIGAMYSAERQISNVIADRNLAFCESNSSTIYLT